MSRTPSPPSPGLLARSLADAGLNLSPSGSPQGVLQDLFPGAVVQPPGTSTPRSSRTPPSRGSAARRSSLYGQATPPGPGSSRRSSPRVSPGRAPQSPRIGQRRPIRRANSLPPNFPLRGSPQRSSPGPGNLTTSDLSEAFNRLTRRERERMNRERRNVQSVTHTSTFTTVFKKGQAPQVVRHSTRVTPARRGPGAAPPQHPVQV